MTDQYTEFDKYKRTGAPVPLSDPPIISQMTDRFVQLTFETSGNFTVDIYPGTARYPGSLQSLQDLENL